MAIIMAKFNSFTHIHVGVHHHAHHCLSAGKWVLEIL